MQSANNETFEEHSILSKYKEGEDFNRRNTLSISRIARKLHFVPKFEPDAVIGQKGALCKGLTLTAAVRYYHLKERFLLRRLSRAGSQQHFLKEKYFGKRNCKVV